MRARMNANHWNTGWELKRSRVYDGIQGHDDVEAGNMMLDEA